MIENEFLSLVPVADFAADPVAIPIQMRAIARFTDQDLRRACLSCFRAIAIRARFWRGADQARGADQRANLLGRRPVAVIIAGFSVRVTAL